MNGKTNLLRIIDWYFDTDEDANEIIELDDSSQEHIWSQLKEGYISSDLCQEGQNGIKLYGRWSLKKGQTELSDYEKSALKELVEAFDSYYNVDEDKDDDNEDNQWTLDDLNEMVNLASGINFYVRKILNF